MIENTAKRYHMRMMKLHATACRRAGLAAAALLLMMLGACTGPQMLNAVTPNGGHELATNLIYDDARGLRLDIYTPHQRKRAPVVVYFHGDRWTEGDKADFRFVGQALTMQGYVAVLPNYRLYPDVRFPAFVEDGAAALKWVRESVARYGGDPAQVFVMGHSSGAHIAAMLALNEDYLKAVGGSRSWIKGMIGLAGPYDFLPLSDPDLRNLFGPPEDFQKSQPIYYVDGQNPPLLLLHGEDDENVRVKNTRNLAQAVARSGGPVEMVIYPKMSHARLLATVSARLRSQSDVLDHIGEFVDRIVAGRPAQQASGGVEGRALPPPPKLGPPVPQALPPPEPLPLPAPLVEPQAPPP